ncbi:hypothetical protein CEXT_342131 [Caerostris extrusa]|uniref:Uncharacterized protein n=1 Tax=Caerostris extrusa TaxID=172846 RepID=A0AAV4TLZ8_CAEEX|nr:hypothetical protein CEXT_342131 [Caerostris extrusa]
MRQPITNLRQKKEECSICVCDKSPILTAPSSKVPAPGPQLKGRRSGHWSTPVGINPPHQTRGNSLGVKRKATISPFGEKFRFPFSPPLHTSVCLKSIA